jgi:hypothetical protein
MLMAVAALPKLIVVAFAGKMLPVVAVVRMLPLKTTRSPRTTTLPELSGMGVAAPPYKLVEFDELTSWFGGVPYKLELLVIVAPYLMLY